MRHTVAVITVSLLGVSVIPAAAVDPTVPVAHYRRASWNEKDGLPSSRIAAITQDHAGYLWLGTDAGLFRFDGVRFLSWEALGRAPLPNNMIRALLLAAIPPQLATTIDGEQVCRIVTPPRALTQFKMNVSYPYAFGPGNGILAGAPQRIRPSCHGGHQSISLL